MSTAPSKKYFEVVVSGQYHALSVVSGTPTLKTYRETFVLPSQEAALSNICKHLLSPRLKKVHADFIRYRTHKLESITLKGYTPNVDVLQLDIDEMNISELSDFCILRQLMIDPYKHGVKDIFQIRELVRKSYQTKRQAAKDMVDSKIGIANAEAETLRKANDLPPEDTETKININEHKATQAVKAKETQTETVPVPGEETVIPADEALPPEEHDPVLE